MPKECLPKDFGGTLPPMAELHDKFRIELTELSDYFKAEEAQRIDGSTKTESNDVQETRSKFQGLDID